ncbi:DinB family protein [Chitinophaga vietnamensis]|uniref:DinB family protein n=1 Tax=Chitinophaga vietnamensis TaxID=2593957 RepID=UPI00117845B1|nr:DinB family protein [Chitinophaga vietnamensis]
MNQLDLFVATALKSWQLQISRATQTFDKLTDKQLYLEVAPGRNRVIYLLGHLTAAHDHLFPLLGLGDRLYPELERAFIRTPDRTVDPLPAPQVLRDAWRHVNAKLEEAFHQLPADAWLERHTQVSEDDFQKEPHRNRINVLFSRIAHVGYHTGQIMLLHANE